MDKCIYCGTETLLYLGNDPVCIECADDIKAGREPGEIRRDPTIKTAGSSWRQRSIATNLQGNHYGADKRLQIRSGTGVRAPLDPVVGPVAECRTGATP